MLTTEFILASNSPRRKKLLSLAGIPFRIQPADINEDPLKDEDPKAYVKRLAQEKSAVVARPLNGEAFVLAADTTVVLDGRILGKPVDAAEARQMLVLQRGRSHMVYTAISLRRMADGAELNDVATTEVPMRNYSDSELERYVASGDPLDKAGGYAIQNAEFHPVENMAGCFANVVGLPLCHLQRTLAKWDVHFEVDLPAACQRHLAYDCPVTEKILNWEL
jgi:MAF protein